MNIVIGCDHAGFALKGAVIKHLQEQGYGILDLGTHSAESCHYPLYAHAVCEKILAGEATLGILICGTGVGMSIVANKHDGIRAACCSDTFSARLTREHNDANVLCLGAKIIGGMIAMEIVKTFMATEPLTAEKYVRRVKKVQKINDEHCVPVK